MLALVVTLKEKIMIISMIAAVGKNRELGKENNLIWRISEDLKFFKATTMGHPIIMGRKTFESLPKALPGRKNIVITRDKTYTAEGAAVVHSIEEAIAAADTDEAFIIGGESIYKAFIAVCDKMYLTLIDGEDKDADAFFPEYESIAWKTRELLKAEENGISYSRILFERVK